MGAMERARLGVIRPLMPKGVEHKGANPTKYRERM